MSVPRARAPRKPRAKPVAAPAAAGARGEVVITLEGRDYPLRPRLRRMCNLYRVTTNVEAMRRLFRVDGAAPNLPLFGEIYPKREAPIIKADATGERRIEVASWGVVGPGNARGLVTNIRNLASPFWRGALQTPERRCLVPVTAFCEWTVEPDPATGRKRKVWFEMNDEQPFVFAGISFRSPPGEPDRFAFLTCAPNTVVGAIHPKAMPVILHGDARDAWLTGDAADALAMPLADELMRIRPADDLI